MKCTSLMLCFKFFLVKWKLHYVRTYTFGVVSNTFHLCLAIKQSKALNTNTSAGITFRNQRQPISFDVELIYKLYAVYIQYIMYTFFYNCTYAPSGWLLFFQQVLDTSEIQNSALAGFVYFCLMHDNNLIHSSFLCANSKHQNCITMHFDAINIICQIMINNLKHIGRNSNLKLQLLIPH